MKKKLKKLLSLCLVLTLSLTACTPQTNITPPITTQEENPVITIVELTGTVWIQNTLQGEKNLLDKNQQLKEDDIIYTDKNSGLIVDLQAGKQIQVGENTVFALSAIRKTANGEITILALKQGSIVNIIDKKLEKGDKYEMHTPRVVMSIRGTSNVMEVDPDGSTIITGLTGDTRGITDNQAYRIIAGMGINVSAENDNVQFFSVSSNDVPNIAKAYMNERNITFDALSPEEIQSAQIGAGDDLENWLTPATDTPTNINNLFATPPEEDTSSENAKIPEQPNQQNNEGSSSTNNSNNQNNPEPSKNTNKDVPKSSDSGGDVSISSNLDTEPTTPSNTDAESTVSSDSAIGAPKFPHVNTEGAISSGSSIGDSTSSDTSTEGAISSGPAIDNSIPSNSNNNVGGNNTSSNNEQPNNNNGSDEEEDNNNPPAEEENNNNPPDEEGNNNPDEEEDTDDSDDEEIPALSLIYTITHIVPNGNSLTAQIQVASGYEQFVTLGTLGDHLNSKGYNVNTDIFSSSDISIVNSKITVPIKAKTFQVILQENEYENLYTFNITNDFLTSLTFYQEGDSYFVKFSIEALKRDFPDAIDWNLYEEKNIQYWSIYLHHLPTVSICNVTKK